MITSVTVEQATANYIDACTHGIAKILSKMGISTVQSYRGAQIFEAIGISSCVIENISPAHLPDWKGSAWTRSPKK